MKKRSILIIGLCLGFLISLELRARESYGLGKVIKAPPVAEQEMGFSHYLVVKKGSQTGAMPIDVKDQEQLQKLDNLDGEFVLFRGDIELVNIPFTDEIQQAEAIRFSKLKHLTLASLRPDIEYIPADSGPFHLSENPKKMTIRLDNQLTQAALLTSAAFILNEATSSGSHESSMGRDMTRGIILTTGLLLIADRLWRGYQVEFGEWDLPQD